MKKVRLVGIENVCCKCGCEKDLSEFEKRKESKKGYSNTCLVCKRKRRKELHNKNRDTISKYYDSNKEKILKSNKIWMSKNKNYRLKYSKEYYRENKDKIIDGRRNNPKVKLYAKKYRKKNRERMNEATNKRNRKNPHRVAFRNILKNTLNRMNIFKKDKTVNLLGYSANELKKHIEALFINNMSWSNYGKGMYKWEIDHIIPVVSFKKNTPMRVVNSLCNLRPLWWIDNFNKKDKILINEINKNKILISIFNKYCYKRKIIANVNGKN